MTVSTTLDRQYFNGNGVTVAFPFNFRFFENSNIYVSLIAPDNTVTLLTLTAHYTLSGALAAGGGTVTMLTAPATGYRLLIQRVLPQTQPTSIRNQGAYFPAIHEDVFDRLTMLVQQAIAGSGNGLQLNQAGNGWDFEGHNGINAADPVNPQDVATKHYTEVYIGSLLETLVGPINNSANVLFIDRDGIPRVVQDLSGDASKMIGYTLNVAGAMNRSLLDKFLEQMTVKDFGAVGDGIATEDTAINLYIAYSNSRGGDDYGNITGTTLKFPDGRYKIAAQLTTITRSGCEIVGASRQGTVFLLPVGVYGVFKFGDGGVTASVVGGGISNCKLEYLTTPNTSSAVVVADQAFRLQFTNMLWVNIGVFMQMGTSASRICGGVTMDNITGSLANVSGIPVFDLAWGAGLLQTNIALFVAGVLAPIHPAAMTTAANRNVFNGVKGFWDTVLNSNCIFERFDYGVNVTAASGMVYQNMFFSGNVTFDYIKTTVFQLSAAVGGVCSKIKADGWFTSWEGPCINIVGGGYNDNHSFKGEVPIAGQEAVSYVVAGPRMNYFELEIGGVNRVATPSNAAMNFVSTATGFIVRGCRGNEDNTGAGTPWRAQHGIRILANSDDYLVDGNKMAGSVGAYYIEANTAASGKRRVSSNTAANYATVAAWPLSASGLPTYNYSPFVIQVTISGGVVTGTTSQNGVAIGGSNFTLDPGEYITVSYSSTPNSYAKTLS